MDKLGSLILPRNEVSKVGGLYLGGYRASINRQFLQSQHITHVLNTAAGLVNFFGPKYEVRNRYLFYHILPLMLFKMWNENNAKYWLLYIATSA